MQARRICSVRSCVGQIGGDAHHQADSRQRIHDRQQRADRAEDVGEAFEEPVHGDGVRLKPDPQLQRRLATGLHKRSKPLAMNGAMRAMDRLEVARLAQAVRQPIDTAGLRQRQRQRARQEVIAPVQVLFARVGQRLAQRADQAMDHRVERARHGLAAPRRRVVHLRDQREVVVPMLSRPALPAPGSAAGMR